MFIYLFSHCLSSYSCSCVEPMSTVSFASRNKEAQTQCLLHVGWPDVPSHVGQNTVVLCPFHTGRAGSLVPLGGIQGVRRLTLHTM